MADGDRRVTPEEPVAALHGHLGRLHVPLDLPGAAAVRDQLRMSAGQLRDQVRPRLARPAAPLLVVVGGPTGAGKSTLVNSIVGRPVSESGVLRPTTRSPVLVHHPADADWFGGGHVLPEVPRAIWCADRAGVPGTLRLLRDRGLPRGLALLDAPDFDSVADGNRELAGQLLAAADLWLFVTSALRYADAVCWEHLRRAAHRDVSLAVLLNRIPAGADDRVWGRLARMLEGAGLAAAPQFSVAECVLDDRGLLPATETEPVAGWLRSLAGDRAGSQSVAGRTVAGALRRLGSDLPRYAAVADGQIRAVRQLREDARVAYDGASRSVTEALRSGAIARGEPLARWRALATARDIAPSLRGQTASSAADELDVALAEALLATVVDAADRAAHRVDRAWRSRPGGARVLADRPELARSAPDLPARVTESVRGWQRAVVELGTPVTRSRPETPRALAFDPAALGPVLALAVLAAGPVDALASRVLAAGYGGPRAVRDLAGRAAADLRDRVSELFDAERRRYDELLDTLEPEVDAVEAVRSAARHLSEAELR